MSHVICVNLRRSTLDTQVKVVWSKTADYLLRKWRLFFYNGVNIVIYRNLFAEFDCHVQRKPPSIVN